MLDVAPRVNPLPLACYGDEDCMGSVKRLAQISSPTKLGLNVLQRYCSYVCCRFLRQMTQ